MKIEGNQKVWVVVNPKPSAARNAGARLLIPGDGVCCRPGWNTILIETEMADLHLFGRIENPTLFTEITKAKAEAERRLAVLK